MVNGEDPMANGEKKKGPRPPDKPARLAFGQSLSMAWSIFDQGLTRD
jgi:hypothetical protein